MSARATCLAWTFLVAGCPVTDDPPDAGGTSSSGGTSDAGPQRACTEFVDEGVPAASLTLRITNTTGQPLYFEQDCELPFIVNGPSGQVTWQPPCITCQQLQSAPGCSAGACAPLKWRIEAGGYLEQAWDGLHRVDDVMPASCWRSAPPGPSNSCQQLRALTEGDYTASFRYHRAADCGDAGSCRCTVGTSACMLGSNTVFTDAEQSATSAPVHYPTAVLLDVQAP